MNGPIVRRDDFWGDFVNGLFFRPVARSIDNASRKTARPGKETVAGDEALNEELSKEHIDTASADPEVRGAAAAALAHGYDIFLPVLGESATGTVIRWLKRVGDRVEVDEPLLDVATDKVDTEIPSPIAGVIEEILVAEDETAEVGAPLVRIGVGAPLVRIGDGAGSAEAAAPAAEAPPVNNEKTAPLGQERPGKETVARDEALNEELSKEHIDTAGVIQVPEQPRPPSPEEFGGNEWLVDNVDKLYERYQQDKNTVDAKWWPLFESFDASDGSSTNGSSGAASAPHPDTRDLPS